jgi:hypothetical protein
MERRLNKRDNFLWEEFEDTKWVICYSKDRLHNGQKKKDKQLSTKHNIEN